MSHKPTEFVEFDGLKNLYYMYPIQSEDSRKGEYIFA